MFSPFTAPYLPFWSMMTLSALTLAALATKFGTPPWWKRLQFSIGELMWGFGIAELLWGLFWVGDALSSQLFTFAADEVQALYSLAADVSPWALTPLLLLIGPAEEIFWRGYVQETLSRHWGANRGYIAATVLYTAAHFPSGNIMLILAALTAGGIWGLCYRLFPKRLTAIILSHALWDAAIFVWFPLH